MYSAVLTALLVESYPNLQEDPQTVTVQLLRQISAQTNSYTISGGHINSTAAFFDPTAVPFEPQATDILVNVCWFASLIFSISSASFAILVKQWLKEYLAIERTRPEERLRIRYFRRGGLKTWKLFEIAAILPLILQVSLSLFFIGLCVFTASVHPSIGTTSICLVGGWAAFFVFTLLAPILSPRCPYKTTFLKRILSTIRIYMLSATKYSLAHPAAIRVYRCYMILAASSKLLVIAAGMRRIHQRVPEFAASLKPRALLVLMRVRQRFSMLRANLTLPATVQLQVAENASRLARWTFITVYHAMWQSENSSSATSQASQPCFNQIKNLILKHEENQICRTIEKDTMIATGIDEMLNDELLAPMELALRQTRPPLQDVIQFAMCCVGLRRSDTRDLRHQIQNAYLYRPLILELLDATRIPMINIIADSLHAAVNQARQYEPIQTGDREQAELAWRFLVILLNKWRHSMPGRVHELMRSLSSHGMLAGCRYFRMRGERAQGLSRIPSNIYDVLPILDAIHGTDVLIVFFQCYFWKDDPQDTRIPRSLLHERLGWNNLDDVPCGSLVALVELALTAVEAARNQRRATGEHLTLGPGEVELIGFVLDAIPLILETRPDHDFRHITIPGAHGRPLRVLKLLFHWPDTLPHLLDCIVARSDVLSADKPRDLLLSAVTDHWRASFNMSHLYKVQS